MLLVSMIMVGVGTFITSKFCVSMTLLPMPVGDGDPPVHYLAALGLSVFFG